MKFINLKNKKIKDNFIKRNTKIGIIGYGIQGRACALNLRDSKFKVYIHQRKDKYLADLKKDKFKNYDLEFLVNSCEVLIILVPDATHKFICDKINRLIKKDKKLIVLPSGYACTFENLKNSKKSNYFLVSPRYPGQVLRQNYLRKKPTIGFYGYEGKPSNYAQKKILLIAKNWGMQNLFFTSMKEEARIDLFIENFLIPRIMGTIEETFNAMTRQGIQKHIAMIEAYQSGEIIGLFKKGLQMGMYKSFHSQTSPTCQFGVSDKYKMINKSAKIHSKKILTEINNGLFYKKLNRQMKNNYKDKDKFNKKKLLSVFAKTQQQLIKFLNQKKITL
tara:strand:+ start:250 stop:1248 length:999 start_codon:yes stop_codon:yes gene_type:complete